METQNLFIVILNGFVNRSLYNKNRIVVDTFIKNFDISSKNPLLAPCPTVNCPYIIADGISEESANNIASFLQEYGCITEINESKLKEQSKQEDLIIDFFKENGSVRCPICGSTTISVGQKGYSLLTGFIGSSKTTNRCGKCGYSWQPK